MKNNEKVSFFGEHRIRRLIIILSLIFCSVVASYFFGMVTQEGRIKQFSDWTVDIAGTINPENITKLKADESDYDNPYYNKLKNYLIQLNDAHPRMRYIYMYGANYIKNELFFYIDTEPSNATNVVRATAVPGEVYPEKDLYIWSTFKTGKPSDVYGGSDEWGEYMSALAAIKNDKGENIAVLGADINTIAWIRDIYLGQFFIYAFFIIIIILYIALCRIYDFFYYEREKTLLKNTLFFSLQAILIAGLFYYGFMFKDYYVTKMQDNVLEKYSVTAARSFEYEIDREKLKRSEFVKEENKNEIMLQANRILQASPLMMKFFVTDKINGNVVLELSKNGFSDLTPAVINDTAQLAGANLKYDNKLVVGRADLSDNLLLTTVVNDPIYFRALQIVFRIVVIAPVFLLVIYVIILFILDEKNRKLATRTEDNVIRYGSKKIRQK